MSLNQAETSGDGKAFSSKLSHGAAARQEFMLLKQLLLLPSSSFPHDSVSYICNRETKECSKCQAPILKHLLLALGRKPTSLLHSSRHRQPVLMSEVWNQTLGFQLLTPMSRKSLELKEKVSCL